jgi:hypothetical protein
MAGPHYLPSGDVISSALSMDSLPNAGGDLYMNSRLEMGQIERIYTIDDKENTSKEASATCTVYDVLIRKPGGTVERVLRARMLQPTFGGGLNNFLEVLPTDPGFDGKNTKKDKAVKRGHYVLVAFIGGRKDTPVILGGMPHINPVAQKKRPKKGKGTYTEGEIQGLNFSVDNDGALKVVFNGPRKDDGSLANKNGPTTINIDKDGRINVSTNAEQSVVIDRVSGKITVTNGPTKVIMDKAADKIDIQAERINTGDGALQPQVVGDDWKKIMEELITEIMALYVPTGVGPSGNPINNPKFAAIKAKLSDALSTHHWVEK